MKLMKQTHKGKRKERK